MKKAGIITIFFLIIICRLPPVYSQERIYFDSETLRDPFIAPEGFEKIDDQSRILLGRVLDDMKIMGIVIAENEKYVIINDSIVKEKEEWQGLTIDRIEKDRLTVLYRGLSTVISYKKDGI